MIEDLTQKIAAWATEIATQAVQLASREARAGFFAARHRELMAAARAQGMGEPEARVLADSCVEGAQRIAAELLARGMPTAAGRA